MKSYFALDVETANADYSSICQIGIVEYIDGNVVDKWSSLINPKDYFDPFNVSIHGISKNDVKNSPTFNDLYLELNEKINGKIVIHHMPFDKIAFNRVCEKYNHKPIDAIWLDSAKIVRRTWTEFSHRGYGLANIASHLGINFKHHNALDDAFAAGEIVSQACKIMGVEVWDWHDHLKKLKNNAQKIHVEANPDGELYGETIVFTGSLKISRKEAAQIAADQGCEVGNSVTKKTTLLVVGLQDENRLQGYEKSSKHRKAEELIQKGNTIQILSETDFIEMCNIDK